MDLHSRPFDEGTIAKLEIFEDYAEAWIPTFVMANVPRIAIFDFFAGQGYDVNGVPGGTIRILQKIKRQLVNISGRNITIEIHINEFKKKKYDRLREACENFLKLNPELVGTIQLHYYNEDFEQLAPRLLSQIGRIPSLVYLDQNGIKAISQKYFQELENKVQTDFLYFVSSSHFWRFGESDEFKRHIDIDIAEAKKDSYRFIHRYVLNKIRKACRKESKLMLYPFSIKKGSNIHGLIFGASHLLAVDKFLRIAWKRNEVNGEANFDIDDDASKAQRNLFSENKLTKLELFADRLRENVLNGHVRNNTDALLFSYSEGHLGSHADEVLRQMKKDSEISFEGASPLVTYENVYKLNKPLRYTVLKT